MKLDDELEIKKNIIKKRKTGLTDYDLWWAENEPIAIVDGYFEGFNNPASYKFGRKVWDAAIKSMVIGD